MKIEAIEFIPLSLPIEAPILTCYGSLASYSRTLIKIVTEGGVVGYARSPAAIRRPCLSPIASCSWASASGKPTTSPSASSTGTTIPSSSQSP
jgi:hypothetical protein